MMRRLLLRLLLLAFALTGDFVVASAQPKDAQAEPLTDRARELHQEGTDLFKKGDFAKARAAYLAAFGIKKHWQIAADLADCEARLKLFRDAAEHATFAIRTFDIQQVPAAKRASFEALPGKLRKIVDDAKPKIHALDLKSNEAGADVSVDGVVMGKTPLADPIFLEPGQRAIEVKKVGFVSKRLDVVASAGGTSAETATLSQEASTAPTPSATAPPAAGTSTPSSGSGSPPGGSDDQVEPSSKSTALIVSGTVLAVAAIGVGATLVGLGVSANGDRADKLAALTGTNPCGQGTPHGSACEEIADLDGDFTTFTSAGGVLLGVGVLAGVATIVYVAIPSSSDAAANKTNDLRLAPLAGPGIGGLRLTGHF